MNFVTFQSVPYKAHVDTGVLWDEVINFLLQINQIKSRALLQILKSRYLVNANILSICLNNSMDPASLTLSGKWFLKLGSPTTKEHCVCLCWCVHAHALMCVCDSVCMYMDVCVCVSVFVFVCVCVYVCLCLRAYVCVCAHERISLWLYARVYVCMHAFMGVYVCLRACFYMRLWVYVCIKIESYINKIPTFLNLVDDAQCQTFD